jgi:catechol 2,3-dioxygenase-like lactoylglutathione lyase family enzyme
LDLWYFLEITETLFAHGNARFGQFDRKLFAYPSTEVLIMSRIRHIAITTKDVDRLVKFYATVFGLKIVPGRGTGTYLSDGHVNLAILPLEPERKTEGPYLKEGFYHFGFQVDDVDALRPISEEMGATSKIEKRPENREVEARLYDPDGNPVDLSKRGWPI